MKEDRLVPLAELVAERKKREAAEKRIQELETEVAAMRAEFDRLRSKLWGQPR